MKNLTYFGAVAFIGLAVSCDVLDLEPQDRISSTAAFSSKEKIEAAVIGAYDALQSPYFLGGRSVAYSEVLAADVVDRGYFSLLYNGTMLANHAWPQNEWTAGYQAIATANRVIEGINQYPEIAGDQADAWIGECKFIRALAHFVLVNHFAQPYRFTDEASHPGIPVITKAFDSNDPEALGPRNTVHEVYQQVIADLIEAEQLLDDNYRDAAYRVIRAIKPTASALLSRVYLYQGAYDLALEKAERVIASDLFSLNARPADPFGTGNYTTAESIFSIPNTATDHPDDELALPMHYSPLPSGRADLLVSPTWLELAGFNPDDLRRNLLRSETSSGTVHTFTTKFADVTNKADWVPVIRYAEVLLTAAEASARISGNVDQGALSRLNAVRDRAQSSAPAYRTEDFDSSAAFIDAILLERRIELAFEGHGIHDILRTKQDVVGKRADDLSLLPTISYGADRLILPIPAYEIDKNPNLVQNNGY